MPMNEATNHVYHVTWTQHPVGHGGFHTGRLQFPLPPPFRWIFDCGSRQTKVFDTYLLEWISRNDEHVDWLFISHFDTDHVSGLETLMANCAVDNVMLPYVNERELLGYLLQIIDAGGTSRYAFDLAADPAAFFLSRGVGRVFYLGSDDPDSRPVYEGGGDGPPGRWGSGIDDCQIKITPPPRSIPGGTPSGAPGQVGLVDGPCTIDVRSIGCSVELKPFRAPIDIAADAELLTRVQDLVGQNLVSKAAPGLGDLAYAIAHHARTRKGKAELRQIYKHHVGSSNRSSLSLLSTPVVQDASYACSVVTRTGRSHWRRGVPAWLNTGDAELLGKQDLPAWQHHYAAELDDVRVLALPHHGSDHNSDAALPALCPGAILTAHVKSDSRKHPGVDVFLTSGDRLHCVTEKADTRLEMHFNYREIAQKTGA